MDIKRAYLENIQYILENGKVTFDERGQETLEIRNLIRTVDDSTTQHGDLKGSIWNGEKLEEYCQQLLDPSDKGFIYDYGNRLRGFDVDQIEYIACKLNEDRNTRRAVAVTWRPHRDTVVSEVPCLILLDFKVRPETVGNMTLNKLHCTAVFRSNDMYGAWYCNAHGIQAVMNHIRRQLDYKCFNGTLTTHSISAHIYMNDIEQAENILMENKDSYDHRPFNKKI